MLGELLNNGVTSLCTKSLRGKMLGYIVEPYLQSLLVHHGVVAVGGSRLLICGTVLSTLCGVERPIVVDKNSIILPEPI